MGEVVADFLVAVGAFFFGDGVSGDLLGVLLEVLDDGFDREIDAALEVHRVHARGQGPLRLRARWRLASTVAGVVPSPAMSEVLESDLAHHLRAHVFELVLKLDFFRDGNAVLGNAGSAEALVDNDVAAQESSVRERRVLGAGDGRGRQREQRSVDQRRADHGTVGVTGRRAGFSPPVDGVAEVKVDVLNVDASFGGAGGGTVQIITKSGTNGLHGAVSEFNQRKSLNATPFFTNSAGGQKTDFKQNQWGTSVGGPLWVPKVYDGRNKVFWFFNYEGHKNSEPLPTYTTVPT